jgi:hypothetical protein
VITWVDYLKIKAVPLEAAPINIIHVDKKGNVWPRFFLPRTRAGGKVNINVGKEEEDNINADNRSLWLYFLMIMARAQFTAYDEAIKSKRPEHPRRPDNQLIYDVMYEMTLAAAASFKMFLKDISAQYEPLK